MSNVHYVYDQLVSKDVAETIDGAKIFTATTTFNGLPNTTTSYTPAADGDLATKKYVDDTVTAGAPDATETVKGISELATGAEAAAGASAGETTGGLVLPASLATSSPFSTGYKIPVTGSDGKLSSLFSAAFSPVGSITAYATTTAPTGWLLCDGSTIASTTYADLFAIIGWSYGGTVGGDFKLPDLRSRNIVMASSTVSQFDTMGETGGETAHTQTWDELAAHSHDYNNYNGGTAGAGTDTMPRQNLDDPSWTSTTGSSTPMNVLDPYFVLNYIIKF
jgi:microcystin-dependent protein